MASRMVVVSSSGADIAGRIAVVGIQAVMTSLVGGSASASGASSKRTTWLVTSDGSSRPAAISLEHVRDQRPGVAALGVERAPARVHLEQRHRRLRLEVDRDAGDRAVGGSGADRGVQAAVAARGVDRDREAAERARPLRLAVLAARHPTVSAPSAAARSRRPSSVSAKTTRGAPSASAEAQRRGRRCARIRRRRAPRSPAPRPAGRGPCGSRPGRCRRRSRPPRGRGPGAA